jgi:hypothetical protein
LMGLDSNRYALIFDRHGETGSLKDGMPAYEEIAWTL